jgi:glyoxylase-like metal-dependent hydrolase (beta-lactamase superfamily II)
MSDIRIIKVGYVNVYLILNAQNSALVDTGNKNHGDFVLQKIKHYGIQPADIKLIILTHTHFDHAGNVAYLKEKTGAKVIVHETEKDDLSRGFTPIPRGTLPFTKITSWLGRNVVSSVGKYDPVQADIVVKEKLDLSPWKIDGYILHTPGHCKGSVSIILGEKALVGDAFFNRVFNIHFPPFADNPDILIYTWQKIFDLKINEIYPGHGPKFGVEEAIPYFKKWKKKLLQYSTT